MSEGAVLPLVLVGPTLGAELSVHPSSTNAKLAISSRTKDRIFMILPFLMICGTSEADTVEPPLARQVCLLVGGARLQGRRVGP